MMAGTIMTRDGSVTFTHVGTEVQTFRDHAKITTTKLVALTLGNLSVSIPHNGERTRPGSLACVIDDQSYWGSC